MEYSSQRLNITLWIFVWLFILYNWLQSVCDIDDTDEIKASPGSTSYQKKHPALTPRASERNFQKLDSVKSQSKSPISGLGIVFYAFSI